MTPISGAVAQADHGRGVDALDQAARLFLGQHRRLAAPHDVLGSAHRMRRVDREHLADDEPVEQHAHGGEVLLDGRLGDGFLQRLDIGRDMQRLDIGELGDAVPFEPGKERARRPVIGHARVLVADRRGEEFEEAAGGMLAGGGDRRRHDDGAGDRGGGPGGRFRDELAHGG